VAAYSPVGTPVSFRHIVYRDSGQFGAGLGGIVGARQDYGGRRRSSVAPHGIDKTENLGVVSHKP